MPLRRWFADASVLPGAPGLYARTVTREDWSTALGDVAAADGRLLALWAGGAPGEAVVHAAFLAAGRGLVLALPAGERALPFPGAASLFPAAARMQRAVADLSGLRSTDADQRPWLRHGSWPEGFLPLVSGAAPVPDPDPCADDYPYVRVEGDGVHEIAVGPVHAGIIEPGHFRFSVVGEKVLRLEERLGYVHKGIERRFTELPALAGHRLAARVSGDSAVAFSWAYCQALEGIAGVRIEPCAAHLRALCLELERLANHLGDLGALGNDAGFAFGLAQFLRLKEQLLRATERALGQRYLFDAIVPGGVARDLDGSAAAELAAAVRGILVEVGALRTVYDEHEGLRDRFAGAGIVTPELAARLGLIGLAGRASGQALDLRVDLPGEPYDRLAITRCIHTEGDVAARVAVRFDEVAEAGRLIARLTATLPAGEHRVPVAPPATAALGIGLVEGWRGPVLVALEAGPGDAIRRCHPHDPSWQNWPVLEHAIIDNIVPDFPLINKSFNLSYSGHDL